MGARRPKTKKSSRVVRTADAVTAVAKAVGAVAYAVAALVALAFLLR